MTARRQVVCYALEGGSGPAGHEEVTRASLAEQLARLLDAEPAGRYDPACGGKAPEFYFVASDTLMHEHAKTALGITGEGDLFGGVVPHAHVATKIITHPLLRPDARAPQGWSQDFGRRVADMVLPGYAAFTLADAKRAAETLLERGPVRLKRARETGGRGQWVATTPREARERLEALDPDELAQCGVALELNLDAVVTLSVGQVRVGPWLASYHGVQRLTPDHSGAAVYGGSELHVVRGAFDALLAVELEEHVRIAVEQARVYDAAAGEEYAPFYASRRNYDVAQGVDAGGTWHSGVLEQSWRVGGASAAELAALAAFAADPALEAVRATCTERYGPCTVPEGAHIHYSAEDPRVGHLTKYVTVQPA